MEIRATAIPDFRLLTPTQHSDPRGFLSEVYSRQALAAAGQLQKRQIWRDRRLMALAAHKRRADRDIGT
jgi:dTDP-4-dehydrorhamnose 3,5-epimerase-like enzyme